MNKKYLYLKIAPSKLMYLGKREKKDVFTSYLGSGSYWKLHLKKHNYTSKDIITYVLFETYDSLEFKKIATYYSNLWNIVESKNFANLCNETGEKGLSNPSLETRNKISYASSNRSAETIQKIINGNKGKKRTKEVKEKISITNKNRSLETREKLRQKQTGRKYSEESKLKMSKIQSNRNSEWREKLSNSQKGKVLSLETRLKISRSQKGKILSEERKLKVSKAVIQMDLEDNFIKEWSSAKLAMKTLNISHVGDICKGKGKTSGGFRWKFK